jgi:hypothetical protein
VEAEERHAGFYPARVIGNPPPSGEAGSGPRRGGYARRVIAFYSRRIGCLGSVLLSLVLTACLILLFVLL